MATCKDCLHYDICLPNSQAFGFKMKTCSKFKNKDIFVEVVRCKDCKYFGRDMGYGKHDCNKYEMPYCLETDFCSYGERKDGAGE